MFALHHSRSFEEVFGSDREELGLIGEGVPIDVRAASFDLGHLSAHEVNPRSEGLTVESDIWHPVNYAVRLIDKMGKLMNTDVTFICRISKALDKVGLGQNH